MRPGTTKNYDPRLKCKFCESMAETEIINGRARDEGLSYGQYVAKYGLFSNDNKYTVAQREKDEKEKQVKEEKKEPKVDKAYRVKQNDLKKRWWEVLV